MAIFKGLYGLKRVKLATIYGLGVTEVLIMVVVLGCVFSRMKTGV
jgi:hypothetical protein